MFGTNTSYAGHGVELEIASLCPKNQHCLTLAVHFHYDMHIKKTRGRRGMGVVIFG